MNYDIEIALRSLFYCGVILSATCVFARGNCMLPLNNDLRPEFLALEKTLAKLGPVRVSHPEVTADDDGHVVAITFCWEFEGTSSEAYDVVRKAVHCFKGRFEWQFKMQFNGKGACISAPSQSVFAGDDQVDIIGDFAVLRSFIDTRLEGTKEPDGSLPSMELSLPDPNEPGMFAVMLSKSPRLADAPFGPEDRVLHFGPTYHEWFALFFRVLRIDGGNALNTGAKPFSFVQTLPEYPILSRLNDIHETIMIRESDVTTLEKECLTVEANTSDPVARKCLEKLILICKWASHLHTNIYLMGD